MDRIRYNEPYKRIAIPVGFGPVIVDQIVLINETAFKVLLRRRLPI
jgi:hypothetical protein